MSLPPSILCYGHDPVLVRTRQQIFERAGLASKTAQSRQELERLFKSFAVDLLVICHTVSTGECEEAKQIAHSQADPSLVLVLNKGTHNCEVGGEDAAFDSRQGPMDLVKTVSLLLMQHGASHMPRQRIPFPRTTNEVGEAPAAA